MIIVKEGFKGKLGSLYLVPFTLFEVWKVGSKSQFRRNGFEIILFQDSGIQIIVKRFFKFVERIKHRGFPSVHFNVSISPCRVGCARIVGYIIRLFI